MRVLCIDIGNTSTHYGRVHTNDWRVDTAAKINTGDISAQLPNVLNAIECEGIAFCSVVPCATEQLKHILAQHKIHSVHLNHTHCPGLSLNYPKPDEIGQDRLANAIAAQTFYGVPAIVIDMGTAVTFDIVTAAGYEGGIIAPGLELMTRYLHEQTALLPALDPHDWVFAGGIGKSTVEAMQVGCFVGFSGMIHALLQRVMQALCKEGAGVAPKVIGTGGAAERLLKDAVPDITLEPNLILLGLAETFRRSTGHPRRQCHP